MAIKKTATILIIEDEAAIRHSYSDHLQDHNYHTIMAENGKIGIELFTNNDVDLIILDLRMPEIDGLRVLEHITKASPDIPVIVVSGTGRIDDTIQALRLGAWDYILKPIEDMSILSHAVSKALERSRLRIENTKYQQELEHLVKERTAESEQITVKLYKVVDIIRNLAGHSEISSFSTQLLSAYIEYLQASSGSFFLKEDDGMKLIAASNAKQTPEFIEFPLSDKSPIQQAISYDGPLAINNVVESHKNSSNNLWYHDGSAIIFPLTDKKKTILGVIILHHFDTDHFTAQDIETGSILASYSSQWLKAAQATAAIRISESRFRDLAELLPEAIFETDKDFNLIFANRRASELFQYGVEEITNRNLNSMEMIVPEERELAQYNVKKRFKGSNPGPLEYNALRKDGTRFPILFHANPIIKDDGIDGLRGVIVDMSDRKRAEKDRAVMEEQYYQSQKMESIGRLAGGVAHDLNNLLAPIIGYGELLLDTMSVDDHRATQISQIQQAGLRARNLVRQLLAFSRKQTLEHKPVDLNNTIIDFQKLLRHTIRENVDIKILPFDGLKTVLADIGQLEQVIMNLAVNAQDAMPYGGTLSIKTDEVTINEPASIQHMDISPGTYAVLTISDNGIGMTEETKRQIFEPFFSTKGEQGTGLGLSTVYGIIKQHGGNILVTSTPEVGTTFTIFLPITDEQATHEHHTSTKIPKKYLGNETIMVVEDNQQVRELCQTILEQQGYTVIPAPNGSIALGILEKDTPPVKLLLTDVVMTGMNGNELYKLACKFIPKLKVLYMSGYSDNIITTDGNLARGIAFIQKPFTVLALAAKVREVLDDIVIT